MGYVAGRYERDGSTLYVNRGFGVAGPPARLGVPPEITKLVLVSG
jgi:predicted MPP superfamily phosphohydrolase